MTVRTSPVEHLLDAVGTEWREVDDARVALRLGSIEQEQRALKTLALCDLSGLYVKLGVKGPAAAGWLDEQTAEVPQQVYETSLDQERCLAVRLGEDEFLYEGIQACATLNALEANLPTAPTGVYRVVREDATFLLVGGGAVDVLAETCGVELRNSPVGKVVLTRMAMVSAGVLPERRGDIPAFRLWVDCSYAVYLWEVLSEIVAEYDGRVIGVAALYPEYS